VNVAIGVGIRVVGGRAAAAAVGATARRYAGPVVGGILGCLLVGSCDFREPGDDDVRPLVGGREVANEPQYCPPDFNCDEKLRALQATRAYLGAIQAAGVDVTLARAQFIKDLTEFNGYCPQYRVVASMLLRGL
jgi:hypothetical protein